MGRLKILVVSERCWPDGSGGELATHLIVSILNRKFDVTVVTGTKNPAKLPHVEYIYEPLLSTWEKPVLWLNALKLARTERFRKLVREADVIYVPRFAFPIIPHAKRMGNKVIVHLHDYIPVSYTATILAPYEEHKHRITRDDVILECMKGSKYCLGVGLLWWLPRLARKCILQADKVICVSRRHAEILADQVSELTGRVEVVYNPLPPEFAINKPRKELDDTPVILYVGGDSYVKGFHVLLQAMKQLGRQGVKTKFILTNKYGSQSLKTLKRLNEKYGNLEIQVVGRVRYDELLELHRNAWALVFPSIWEEPLPYAVIESMLMGTLPLAAKVGAISEIVKGSPAERYLFEPRNVEEMLLRIKNVTSMSMKDIGELSYRLRELVKEKFSEEAIRKSILEIFQKDKQ